MMPKINNFEPRECKNTRELLDDFLAGQLLVETNREILLHLDKCEACRQEKISREAILHRLREAWQAQSTPDTLEGRILSDLAGPALSFWFRMVAGLIITAVALAGLYLFFSPSGQTVAAVDHYAQVIHDHLNCTGQPLPPGFVPPLQDVQADVRHTMAAGANSYDLMAIHFCEVEGVQLVHYVFQGRDRFLSLMLEARSSQDGLVRHRDETQRMIQGMAVKLIQRESLYVASLESPGYFVYLVSEESTERSLQFVERLLPSIRTALFTM